MRLDARRGDVGWTVFDVPRCRRLRDVVAVDDATAELEVFDKPIRVAPCGRIATHIERCKRIAILAEQRLVLIDPVDDATGEPAQLGVEDVAWG